MAGLLTNEPVPRDDPADWAAWVPGGTTIIELKEPKARTGLAYDQVLSRRRSTLGGEIGWSAISELLWRTCRTIERRGTGRAGIPIEHRPLPSAGGLHAVSVVARLFGAGQPPRLYLPGRHAFALLQDIADGSTISYENAISEATGATAGCTLLFVGDYTKIAAAYSHPESLLWRDAGVLLAGLCLTAEWMGLTHTPVGVHGSAHLQAIGFPSDRFMGLGAIHVGTKIGDAA